MSSWDWAFTLGGWLLAAGGLMLLLAALFRDRSRGRRRCSRCWYDMSGVPGLICPECGREARNPRGLLRTRRRWRRAAVGLLIIACGWGVGVTPRVARSGVVGVVPTPMLTAASLVYDTEDHRIFGELVCRIGEERQSPASITRWLLRHRIQRAFVDPEAGVTLPSRATRTQWIVTAPATSAPASTMTMTVSGGSVLFPGVNVLQGTHAINLARQSGFHDPATAGAAAGAIRRTLGADLKVTLTQFVSECTDGRARAELLSSVLRGEKLHRVRTTAAEGLGVAGTDASIATPALTQALTSKSAWTRVACATSLGRLGAGAAPAIPDLVQSALTDTDISVVREACRALRLIGEAAPEVRPAAVDGLSELAIADGKLARESSVHELDQSADLGCACAGKLVAPAADAEQPNRQTWALEAMAKLAHQGCSTEAEFSRALTSGAQWQARVAALEGLDAMTLRGDSMARYAMRAMADPSPRVRRTAVRLLCKLGDSVTAAREAVLRATEDPDDHVRYPAKEWLERRRERP